MDSNTTGLSASSTLGGPKFKIHQSIPSGSVKRGPHAIVRSVELNDCIEIQRRCGEGSIPLFDRHDITVNQTINESNDKKTNHEQHTGGKSKTNRRSSSRESSSPERYRHRDSKKHSSSSMSGRRKTPERTARSERPNNNRDHHSYNLKYSSNNTKTDKYKRKDKSKSHTPSPNKKKPVEKVPYYRDEQREKDRLKRLYGRSCSRSPPPTSRSSARKYSPITKRRIESPPRRRRSRSRDRHRKYSPHRSSRRDYRTHRSSRSRSRSRTRSPSRRERHKHYSRSSRERDKEHKEDANNRNTAILPPTPQFILPVAVPADYAAAAAAYSFPGWTAAPQLAWHPGHHRPPAAAAPFPMVSMLPALRPPPHQASYAGLPPALAYPPITPPYRPHIPQRYPPPRHNTNNYHSRPKKPTS